MVAAHGVVQVGFRAASQHRKRLVAGDCQEPRWSPGILLEVAGLPPDGRNTSLTISWPPRLRSRRTRIGTPHIVPLETAPACELRRRHRFEQVSLQSLPGRGQGRRPGRGWSTRKRCPFESAPLRVSLGLIGAG